MATREKIEFVGIKVYIGIILCLVLFIYSATFKWLKDIYFAPDSYYSHGFLVPLISIFLVWLKRDKLKYIDFIASKSGIFILCCSLLLQFLSVLTEVYIISVISFFMLICGIVIYLFGKDTFKKLLFPIGFLLFMVPMPMFIINYISFPLRQLATAAVVSTIKLAGLPVAQKGFEIIFPNSSLSIDTPCSGLRSLIAFMALGALFAYFLKNSNGKKILLFSLTIPIALVSNYVRILLLSLITFIYGGRIATGTFLHEFSGILVFVMGFIMLSFVRRILNNEI